MKNLALCFVAVLLLVGVIFLVASSNAPQVKAADLSEGTYPSPALHPNAPQQAMIPGEGSYPSPACSPQNPKCGGTGTALIAGEGSYPSPACSPQNPKCGGTGTSVKMIALMGDGSAPAPFAMPSGGMN